MHRRGQEILTDPFDLVGMGASEVSCLEVLIVERADRIGTDDLDVRILLL